MKVFATKYLESMSSEKVNGANEWTWHPQNVEVENIYACGNNTASNESTYAAEKDSRADRDRPNEGLYVA